MSVSMVNCLCRVILGVHSSSWCVHMSLLGPISHIFCRAFSTPPPPLILSAEQVRYPEGKGHWGKGVAELDDERSWHDQGGVARLRQDREIVSRPARFGLCCVRPPKCCCCRGFRKSVGLQGLWPRRTRHRVARYHVDECLGPRFSKSRPVWVWRSVACIRLDSYVCMPVRTRLRDGLRHRECPAANRISGASRV